MKRILLIFMAVLLLVAVPVWADEDQPSQNPQAGSSGYGYEGMGPGMMGPGSGYQERGPGMMNRGRDMNRDRDRDRDMGGYDRGMSGYGGGMGGYGQGMMGPDDDGWRGMSPEQREQWRQMRSRFMSDTLPMRQELGSKRMELETLWEQPNPDPDKVKALSGRINELHTNLQQKQDAYLMECRKTVWKPRLGLPGQWVVRPIGARSAEE